MALLKLENDFFSQCDDIERMNLDHIIVNQELKPGEIIQFEATNSETLFYIKDGTIKVTKVTKGTADMTFHYFYSGDTIGEFTHPSETTDMYTLEAMTPCTLGTAHYNDVERALQSEKRNKIVVSKWFAKLQAVQGKLYHFFLPSKAAHLHQ